MNYREEIGLLKECIGEMLAEMDANHQENERTSKHIGIAMLAIRHFESKQRMADFITFCQTGKYPNG